MPINSLYSHSLNIRYNCYSRVQKSFHEALYNAVENGLERLDVPAGLSGEEVFGIINMLAKDCPELCRFDNKSVVLHSTQRGNISTPCYVSLAYHHDITETDRLRFIRELSVIAASCRSSSLEVVLTKLNIALSDRLTYSHVDNKTEYHAYYSWKARKGVCDSYTQLFCLLCRMAGVACSYIGGKTTDAHTKQESPDGHAWNIISVQGIYSLMDPTWNDLDRKKGHIFAWTCLSSDRLYKYRRPDDKWYNKILPGNCIELFGHRQLRSTDEIAAYISSRPSSPVLWLTDSINKNDALMSASAAGLRWKSSMDESAISTIVFSGCSYIDTASVYPVCNAGQFLKALTRCRENRFKSFRLSFSQNMYSTLDSRILAKHLERNGILYDSCQYSSEFCYFEYSGCSYVPIPQVLNTAADIKAFINANKHQRTITMYLSDTAYRSYDSAAIGRIAALTGVILGKGTYNDSSMRYTFDIDRLYQHVFSFETDDEFIRALLYVKTRGYSWPDCMFVTSPQTAAKYMSNDWARFKAVIGSVKAYGSFSGNSDKGYFTFKELRFS